MNNATLTTCSKVLIVFETNLKKSVITDSRTRPSKEGKKKKEKEKKKCVKALLRAQSTYLTSSHLTPTPSGIYPPGSAIEGT